VPQSRRHTGDARFNWACKLAFILVTHGTNISRLAVLQPLDHPC